MLTFADLEDFCITEISSDLVYLKRTLYKRAKDFSLRHWKFHFLQTADVS